MGAGPVNEEKLLEQLDGDREFLREMLGEFASLFPEQMQEIENAVAAGNPETVRSVAHSMKGAAANLFLERLAEDARTLEFMGRGGDLAGAADLLAALRQEFAALQAYMSAL